MNEANDTNSRRNEKLEEAVEGLFSVGRMWASHGLKVGEVALTTSAHTLKTTAKTLHAIAEQLTDEAEEIEQTNVRVETPEEEDAGSE